MIARPRVEGDDIVPGEIGENVTVEGLDRAAMVPRCHVLHGGSVLLQITSYTRPCVKIARSFKEGCFGRVSQKRPVRLLNEVEGAEVNAGAAR